MAPEGFRTVVRNLDYATIKNMPPSRPISSVSFASSQDESVNSPGVLSTYEKGEALSRILHPTRTVTFEAVDPCIGDADGRGDSPPRFARRVLESLVEQTPSPAGSEEPVVDISKGKAVELLQCEFFINECPLTIRYRQILLRQNVESISYSSSIAMYNMNITLS